MSKPIWWTCGCGRKNCSRGIRRPECEGCGNVAKFAIAAPKDQAGFDFAEEGKADEFA